MSNALRSPDVAFVLVTSPDPLAVHEAVFFADKLGEHGMRQAATVINRVTPLLREPHGTRSARCTQALRRACPSELDGAALEREAVAARSTTSACAR